MATNKFEGKKVKKIYICLVELSNLQTPVMQHEVSFYNQIILYGDHFTAEGRQRATFWKGTWSPEVTLLINGNYTSSTFFFEFRK